MATEQQTLAVAATQVGVREMPPGSNDVTFNHWWVNRYGGPLRVAWCARFLSWVFAQVGIGIAFQGTRAFAEQMRRAGRVTRTPQVGAIALMFAGHEPGTGHTGIVERVAPDGTFFTIEGNTDERGGRTGGRVMRKHRPMSALGSSGGFVMPAYEEVLVSSAPARQRPIIRLGSKGPDVAHLQNRLNQVGYQPQLVGDGDFGPRTRTAVLWFQRSRGLTADGVVGPKTWAAIGP